MKRVQSLLAHANDKGAVELQIANIYAAGGQYTTALCLLTRVVDENLGFDPSRDIDFKPLRTSIEFQKLVKRALERMPPVTHSRLVARIDEPDLFPENIAFDPANRTFYVGSTIRSGVTRCSVAGYCSVFARFPGYSLGLKVRAKDRMLWVTANTAQSASLRAYDLATGHVTTVAELPGRHVFNDLAVASNGDVYVTDTPGAAVYQLKAAIIPYRNFLPNTHAPPRTESLFHRTDARCTSRSGVTASHWWICRGEG